MSKIIQVLKPYFRIDETMDEIRECLEKGWTGMGFKTEQFESAWKSYTGFKFAHFLNSATSGLHLAIKIYKDKNKWNSENEIITSSLTFVSTNHAILYENMKPVFADVDSSLCLNPLSVEKMINSNTKAIIYIGIGGNAENYKNIKNLCIKYNLILILDAAHMSGTTWLDSGEHVGLDADCAIFSYQAVKNCPSSDSGMICFASEELDKKVRQLSWLGIDKSTFDRYTESSYKWRYDVSELGFKYHGNSITAAICLVSLKYLDVDNDYRRSLTATYDKILNNRDGIEIIRHSKEIQSSRHLYQIAVNNRDNLIEKLSNKGIYCGVHYIVNHKYSIFNNFKADAKMAEYYSDRIISLPLHLSLAQDDIEYISNIIINS